MINQPGNSQPQNRQRLGHRKDVGGGDVSAHHRAPVLAIAAVIAVAASQRRSNNVTAN
jgi:hypothetical protein